MRKGFSAMTKIIIDDMYEKTVESLKKLNNQLFYDELKTTLRDTSDRLGDNYLTTTTKMDSMEKNVNRQLIFFEEAITKMQNEFQYLTQEVLEETSNTILVKFNEREEKLEGVMSNFVPIQQKLFDVYRELQKLHNTHSENAISYLENTQISLTKATTDIHLLLSEWATKQEEMVKVYFETVVEKNTIFLADFEEKYQIELISIQNASSEHIIQLQERLSNNELIANQIREDLNKNHEAQLKKFNEKVMHDNKNHTLLLRLVIGLAIGEAIILIGQFLV